MGGGEFNSGLRPKGLERSFMKRWARYISMNNKGKHLEDDYRRVPSVPSILKLLSKVISAGDPMVDKGRTMGNQSPILAKVPLPPNPPRETS